MSPERPLPTVHEPESLIGVPFAKLPGEMVLESFGVRYVHLQTGDGGDLFLTEYGWPYAEHLLPDNWFSGEHYAKAGSRLPGSTGVVYRVPSRPVANQSIELVVKFSRVGQEVPLQIATSFDEKVPRDAIENARFNSPFEEFGLVMDMRNGAYGPTELRLLSHRPLAIFAPPQESDLWQLGRSRGRFRVPQLLMQKDQQAVAGPLAIELDIKRSYVVLYSWLKGLDATAHGEAGELSETEVAELTYRANREMAAKGFYVLDSKPRHLILRRRRRNGEFLRRNGRLVYGLIDFELLDRTEAYRQVYRRTRRARYLAIERGSQAIIEREPDRSLIRAKLFGVDYVCGTAPNGGRIWVVGHNAELFDYFLPDRWRRTGRLKLSAINEVYRTRTRDNVFIVYYRSRVGEKPHVEPAYRTGRRIKEYGFNSPFEEIAIAERLRAAGIPTVYPRAIYETGHESEKASYLFDGSRYESHKLLRVPPTASRPILDTRHDYYTIWGQWRGIDMMRGRSDVALTPPAVDLQEALERNWLGHDEHQRTLARTLSRMPAMGFTDATTQQTQFLIRVDPATQTPARRDDGELDISFAVDALRAMEQGIIDERTYRGLLERQHARLYDAGFDALDLHGDHMLLACDLDGVLANDSNGEILVTHCSFQLIQPLKPLDSIAASPDA